MLTHDEESYILKNAYIPEHIVSLMTILSKGEPFLAEEYVYYVKDDAAIVIGYPLNGEFSLNHFDRFVKTLMKSLSCNYLRMAAPKLPDIYLKDALDKSSDEYFILPLEGFSVKSSLKREIQSALKTVTTERTKIFEESHSMLIDEMIKRVKPNERIRKLYLSMPDYISKSNTALVLDAKDSRGRLVAFYILELAAERFVTYLLGCHSKNNYIPHASDVLFYEMIKIAREKMKEYINLGLGVSSGIVRFKEKWGGIPYLPYEFCEYRKRRINILQTIHALKTKL